MKVSSIRFTSIPVVKKRSQCVQMACINPFLSFSWKQWKWLYESSVLILQSLQGGNKHSFSIPFPIAFMTTFHSLWHQYPTQKGIKVKTPEDGRFELSQQPLKSPLSHSSAFSLYLSTPLQTLYLRRYTFTTFFAKCTGSLYQPLSIKVNKLKSIRIKKKNMKHL